MTGKDSISMSQSVLHTLPIKKEPEAKKKSYSKCTQNVSTDLLQHFFYKNISSGLDKKTKKF